MASQEPSRSDDGGDAQERATAGSEPSAVRLLRRLNAWFLESAPEHYRGCGLHIDVEAALTKPQCEPSPHTVEEWRAAYEHAASECGRLAGLLCEALSGAGGRSQDGATDRQTLTPAPR